MNSDSGQHGARARPSGPDGGFDAPSRGPRSAADEPEAQRVLAQLLARLDEPLRTTLVRHFVHGLDAGEIARIEGVPPSTVRTRIAHGVELLRSELDRRRGPRRGAWHALLGALVRRPRGSLRTFAASTPVLLSIFLVAAAGLSVWILSRAPEVFGRGHDAFDVAAHAPRPRAQLEDPARLAPHPRTSSDPAAPSPVAPASIARIDDETVRVLARVVDEDGAPISGATIELDRFAPGQEPAVAPRATAGTNGEVELEFALARPAGDDFVHCLGRLDEPLAIATAPGFVAFARRVPIQEGRVSGVGEFVLSRARSLRGRVLDAEGRPLADARVLLSRGAAPVTAWPIDEPASEHVGPRRVSWDGLAPSAGALVAATDDEGRYVFEELLGGPHYVDFELPGFSPARLAPVMLGRELGGSDDAVLPDVVLARDEHWLRLRVRGLRGEPAGSSYVALAKPGEESRFAGYTDEAGEFALRVPDDAPRDVFVTGNSQHKGTTIARELRASAEPIELVLQAPRFVQLELRGRDGSPAAGAWLGFHLEGRGWAKFEPDHESTFVLRIPASRFDLDVFAAGCDALELVDIDPDSVPDPWVLSPLEVDRIRGRALRADGTPLTAGRALVTFPTGIEPPAVEYGLPARVFEAHRADDGVIAPDGTFELPRRMPGPFFISIAEVGGLLHESGPFTFESGRDVEGLEVRLHEFGTLAGRLRVPAGDPARAELTSLFVGASSGDRRFIYAHVDAEGRFDFGEVTPGRWWLRRVVVDTNGTTRAAESTAPYLETYVAAGARVEVELDFERQLPAHVEGRARLDDAPLAGWATSITLAGAGEAQAGCVRADGTFSLRAELRERARVRIVEPAGARAQRSFEREVEFPRGADANADLLLRSARFLGRAAPLAGRTLALVSTTPDGWTCVTRVRVGDDGAIAPFRAPAGRGIVQAVDARGEPAGVVLSHYTADVDARDPVELVID